MKAETDPALDRFDEVVAVDILDLAFRVPTALPMPLDLTNSKELDSIGVGRFEGHLEAVDPTFAFGLEPHLKGSLVPGVVRDAEHSAHAPPATKLMEDSIRNSHV